MTLYYSLYNTNQRNTHAWHIHENNSSMNDAGRNYVEVQADGDELEAIRTQFNNLPMHSRHVVRWAGDMAAFIAMNLQSYAKE